MLIERITSQVANNTSSSTVTCDDIHHCRTIPGIILSCASTLFLCTWVALHPDVPVPVRSLASGGTHRAYVGGASRAGGHTYRGVHRMDCSRNRHCRPSTSALLGIAVRLAFCKWGYEELGIVCAVLQALVIALA